MAVFNLRIEVNGTSKTVEIDVPASQIADFGVSSAELEAGIRPADLEFYMMEEVFNHIDYDFWLVEA